MRQCNSKGHLQWSQFCTYKHSGVAKCSANLGKALWSITHTNLQLSCSVYSYYRGLLLKYEDLRPHTSLWCNIKILHKGGIKMEISWRSKSLAKAPFHSLTQPLRQTFWAKVPPCLIANRFMPQFHIFAGIGGAQLKVMIIWER